MSDPVLQVTGGAGGVAATYAQLRDLAATYDATGDRLRARAGATGRLALDPGLFLTSPLSPLTCAEVEARLVELGADLLVSSAGWWADAVAVRGAVAALEECDALVAGGLAALHHEVGEWVGRTVRVTAPTWLPVALAGTGVVALLWPHLPPAGRAHAQREAERWLVEHPGVVEHAAAGGGGLLQGLLGVPVADTEAGAALLSQAYAEGPVSVTASPSAVPAGNVAPAGVSDVVEHLRQLSALSGPGSPEHDGTIEVQTLLAPDGGRRHVVYLPGTDDMTTLPWTRDDDVRDMGANLALVGDRDAGYVRGVVTALREAGAGPGEPVLLAGHSQGGLVAAWLLAHRDEVGIDATHAITLGAPVAGLGPYPEGSHVLSLENRGDLVPLLDGAPNPDTVEQATVLVDAGSERGGGPVAGHHGFGPFGQAAYAVDRSAHPSVREQLTSLREAGFVGAQVQTSRVYRLTYG